MVVYSFRQLLRVLSPLSTKGLPQNSALFQKKYTLEGSKITIAFIQIQFTYLDQQIIDIELQVGKVINSIQEK